MGISVDNPIYNSFYVILMCIIAIMDNLSNYLTGSILFDLKVGFFNSGNDCSGRNINTRYGLEFRSM